MKKVLSWGRLSAHNHEIIELTDSRKISDALIQNNPGVSFGMGRSYGDVCLNPEGILWNTKKLDHFIHFDEITGRLICESGVLLRDIQRTMISRGFILPVTPGTQLATVGGALANDVHGKNHHKQGSFGDHVKRFKLIRTTGEIIECSEQNNKEWFLATIGGLGLTGVISEVEIQLKKVKGPWLNVEIIPYANTDEFFSLADDSESAWEYTVSWVDCLHAKGRGIFMRGNSSDMTNLRSESRARRFPFTPPFSLVNPLSLRLFNALYFKLQKHKRGQSQAHYESFFYPLDNLLEWNRLYGPKGFFQYQCVVPPENRKETTQLLLTEISKSSQGSFLTVLKTFGHRYPLGMLSFPMPGVTLALDFPNKGAATLKLFERLDRIVQEAGGRIYLAKDARLSREFFEASYPRVNEFIKYRDPGISSGMSRRLMGS